MAEMIWCQSCKTVVWAYDHQPHVGMSGIANMLRLPCPVCGSKGNYDGWGIDKLTDELKEALAKHSDTPIFDRWAAMKAIGNANGMTWLPSPDNDWFRRP